MLLLQRRARYSKMTEFWQKFWPLTCTFLLEMKDIIVVYHSVEATCPVKISWQVGPKPKKILVTHSVETAWPGFNSTRSTGFLIDSFEVFILFNWFIWFNWLRFISFRRFPLIQMFIPLKLDQLVNSFDSFNRFFCWVSIKVHLFLKFGHLFYNSIAQNPCVLHQWYVYTSKSQWKLDASFHKIL